MELKKILKNTIKLLHSKKLKYFVAVGLFASAINLFIIYLMIDVLGLDNYILRNISNISAVLVSTAFAFFLNRNWTWSNSPKKFGPMLFKQYVLYNSFTLVGLFIRFVLFAILDLYGTHYILNVIIGIGAAASFNFIAYEKMVFRKERFYEIDKV